MCSRFVSVDSFRLDLLTMGRENILLKMKVYLGINVSLPSFKTQLVL